MSKSCRCCNNKIKTIFTDEFVLISECLKCKTLEISHLKIKNEDKKKDYYSKEFFYNKDTLERSLLLTRKRQALKILKRISNISSKNIQLIDYGCGKGVFLKEAHKFSYKSLVGVESSKKAIKNLGSTFYMIRVKFDQNKINFVNKFNFVNKSYIQIFAALDVIEHFPKSNLKNWLKMILKKFSYPKYLIIKVPSRNGFLFNFAYFLAKFKLFKKPLYQLLQVGTYPPHYFYFSEKGLINLFSFLNYIPIYKMNDLDYELSSFGARLDIKGSKNIIIKVMVPFLAFLTKITKSDDSKIIIFRHNK